MSSESERKEAEEQGRRDTEGRPLISAVQEEKKEKKENKEKPIDPE